jgi:prolyl-tRNA synthetase
MAPFQVVIVPIDYHRSISVKQSAELLYQKLSQQGFDVLIDDRSERPGLLFADQDLIGIPHRLVLSEKTMQAKSVEYKARTAVNEQFVYIDEITHFLQKKLKLVTLPEKAL